MIKSYLLNLEENTARFASQIGAPSVKVDSCHEEGLEWIAGCFENRVWVPEGDLLLELVSDLVVGGVRVNFCWKIMGKAF